MCGTIIIYSDLHKTKTIRVPIFSMVTCNCENWTMKGKHKCKTESAEVKFLYSVAGYLYTAGSEVLT